MSRDTTHESREHAGVFTRDSCLVSLSTGPGSGPFADPPSTAIISPIPNPHDSHTAFGWGGGVMRDPMSWSIPLFRAFGIQVKLHILYIIITLAQLLRVYSQPGGRLGGHLAEFALIWVVMLFIVVLLHEFGHCFAARKVDGEADEILMWPLGGLAYCSVPHTARANFICTLGGPLVNVILCLVTAALLSVAGYLPPLNILEGRQLYHPELHNWQTGGEGKPYLDSPYFIADDGRRLPTMYHSEQPDGKYLVPDPNKPDQWISAKRSEFEVYPSWVLCTARLFWLNWMLLLFNLIPAFPLDGGPFLQEILWARSGDYRSATQVACWSGIVTSLLFFLIAFWQNDTMLFALGIFMLFTSYQQLVLLERGMIEEGGAFGYDFSKGYAGFGPEEDWPPPTTRRAR